MDLKQTIELTGKLISIPSVTGNETAVLDFAFSVLSELDWDVERYDVEQGRYNIFCKTGTPRIIFTTHLDVVPAAEELFTPRLEGDSLYGRGACDAKGVAATMISTCKNLLNKGETDFGLLLVVGEEADGIGARTAGKDLCGFGIKYLINGEPTEGKIAVAHKGGYGAKIAFNGKAAHSGYPELGVDANAKAIRCADQLINTDFGEDPVLGRATVNIGSLSGGTASNVISPSAELDLLVRCVTSVEEVREKVKAIVGDCGEIAEYYNCVIAKNLSIPGFEEMVAAYCTDIPYFAELDVQTVLYGPGSIHVAHTNHEHITAGDIEEALSGYMKIYEFLKEK